MCALVLCVFSICVCGHICLCIIKWRFHTLEHTDAKSNDVIPGPAIIKNVYIYMYGDCTHVH